MGEYSFADNYLNGVSTDDIYCFDSTLVDATAENQNFGGDALLSLADINGHRRIIIRWTGIENHITDPSTIYSAVIRLYISSTGNKSIDSMTFDVYSVAGDSQWSEGSGRFASPSLNGVTWNNRSAGYPDEELWSTPGGDLGTLCASYTRKFDAEFTSGYLEIPLNTEGINKLRQFVETPSSNLGFIIKLTVNDYEWGESWYVYIASSEDTDIDQKPALVITTGAPVEGKGAPPATTVTGTKYGHPSWKPRIKPGYFYLNDDEYYLYANKGVAEIGKIVGDNDLTLVEEYLSYQTVETFDKDTVELDEDMKVFNGIYLKPEGKTGSITFTIKSDNLVNLVKLKVK